MITSVEYGTNAFALWANAVLTMYRAWTPEAIDALGREAAAVERHFDRIAVSGTGAAAEILPQVAGQVLSREDRHALLGRPRGLSDLRRKLAVVTATLARVPPPQAERFDRAWAELERHYPAFSADPENTAPRPGGRTDGDYPGPGAASAILAEVDAGLHRPERFGADRGEVVLDLGNERIVTHFDPVLGELRRTAYEPLSVDIRTDTPHEDLLVRGPVVDDVEDRFDLERRMEVTNAAMIVAEALVGEDHVRRMALRFRFVDDEGTTNQADYWIKTQTITIFGGPWSPYFALHEIGHALDHQSAPPGHVYASDDPTHPVGMFARVARKLYVPFFEQLARYELRQELEELVGQAQVAQAPQEVTDPNRREMITAIIREVTDELRDNGSCPLTGGFCGDIVDAVWRRSEAVGIEGLQGMSDEDVRSHGSRLPTHNWIYDPVNRLHFDASRPDGVADWRELQDFERSFDGGGGRGTLLHNLELGPVPTADVLEGLGFSSAQAASLAFDLPDPELRLANPDAELQGLLDVEALARRYGLSAFTDAEVRKLVAVARLVPVHPVGDGAPSVVDPELRFEAIWTHLSGRHEVFARAFDQAARRATRRRGLVFGPDPWPGDLPDDLFDRVEPVLLSALEQGMEMDLERWRSDQDRFEMQDVIAAAAVAGVPAVVLLKQVLGW